MYSRAGVVGFAAFLLCALLLFTGFVPYTAAHAHVGSLRNVAVYCGTVYRVALVAPHRVDSTAARPFDTRRPPCALSLVRRKLSFALQLPSGHSCPPAVLDLHPFCVSTRSSLHLSPPCSTFQEVVRKSLFTNSPIDPLEQTSSKQVASPSPLRSLAIKHATLSPDITTDS
jgi:hypothetical protein